MPEHIDHEPRLLFPSLNLSTTLSSLWPGRYSHRGRLELAGAWLGKVSRGPSAYIRPFMEQGFDPALPWI